MSNKPKAEFKGKGVRIVVWANSTGNTYTVEKFWKDKATGEWKRQKLSLWPSELSEMTGLMIRASDYEKANSEPPRGEDEYSPQRVSSADFADDDIPF